ncbi:Putative DNA-binding protein in cluster with Type I restriction-modification system [Alloactinosynnema sp. L-07]|uniref:Scr1 family TA system antitoxin-like transcriptional regulator n=1 Tax=Alloactinosynnema sp. L-07 TaxID=1653480 RepID=UPI00065F05C9|nr:Scr1 family TA system antitoxin-like transcriptional regulator [Alloactinosynnema sp. L-07]CRK57567.1 Putative DNA-binding protein in cluster with Type I restriction-modification system [Alloactinosynnema sp. L-07]
MRGLAAELKTLRKNSERTTLEIAKRSGFSPPVLNRMENGLREVTVEECATLLAIYGIKGKERIRIMNLAKQPGDMLIFRGDVAEVLRALVNFESTSTRIVEGSMMRVPGLLQTADYMRAVMVIARMSPDYIKDMVATRLKRQEVLWKQGAPTYLAILDEIAIRRRTGSAELMAEQIVHLCDMAQRPNIDIRVIPIDHGAHDGLDGNYKLMEFAKGDPVILLEHRSSSLFVDESSEIELHQNVTDRLVEVALSSADTVKFLRRLEAEFRRE